MMDYTLAELQKLRTDWLEENRDFCQALYWLADSNGKDLQVLSNRVKILEIGNVTVMTGNRCEGFSATRNKYLDRRTLSIFQGAPKITKDTMDEIEFGRWLQLATRRLAYVPIAAMPVTDAHFIRPGAWQVAVRVEIAKARDEVAQADAMRETAEKQRLEDMLLIGQEV